MRRMPRALALAGLALAAPSLAAALTIGAILDAPPTYDGEQVTVVGTVVAPVADHRGESAYNLQDGTRRISVFGSGPAPHPGEHLQVSGKVGYKAPDEEFSFPPILLETTRTPAP
jgi:hypothetical protein